MPDKQARQDIRKKIALEKRLTKILRPYNNKIVKDVVNSYAKNGEIISAFEFAPEMEEMLIDHYEATGNKFDDNISKTLPKDLAETPEERNIIDSILAAYFLTRAPNQANIITNTTQKNINDSILAGTEQAIKDTVEGGFPSRREIARNAGASLKRKLNGRNSGISATETQNIAEQAKQVEVEVLTLGVPQEFDPDKEWVTAGDEIVRHPPKSKFNHVAADGQKVKINALFIVSGQLLKIPGDTSHGASLGNIINCRCNSVVDRDSVINARRFIFDEKERISFETEVPVPEFAFN